MSIQAGYVDPQNLLFARERIGEVREAAPKVHEALSTLDEKCAEIFRDIRIPAGRIRSDGPGLLQIQRLH